MILRLFPLLLAAALVSPLAAKMAIPCSVDPLINAPQSWKMTTAEFEQTYSKGRNQLFRWLTADKTRAKLVPNLFHNARIQLSAFEGTVPVQEVIVDFADGELNLVSISFYNRGDNGPMSRELFVERCSAVRVAIGEQMSIRPRVRQAKPSNGLLTQGYSWHAAQIGIAVLEHNADALTTGKREFLRLRMARPHAKGMLAASLKHERGGSAVRIGQLSRNIEKTDTGDVYVASLPMVDQGSKGYCVAASVQRLFEYYGIGADMHQIAEIAGSDPRRGTNTYAMATELDKIDYRFKTRLDILAMGRPLTEVDKRKGKLVVGDPFEHKDFVKEVKEHINTGLPLLWSLQLGRYPETPNLNPQTSGGHMRMIIGYNDRTDELLFSDSWGAGHELKRMKMEHAYKASHGLFALKPTVR